jgi:hypothetical protein
MPRCACIPKEDSALDRDAPWDGTQHEKYKQRNVGFQGCQPEVKGENVEELEENENDGVAARSKDEAEEAACAVLFQPPFLQDLCS